MTTIGQLEKRTQARVVALFRERLCYDFLGDKTDLDNRNIEETLLRSWLTRQGVSETLTIENNVRKLIINESPVDPAY